MADEETPRDGVADYLEKLARESFDREIDQDETMWRALPVFAAGIGLLVNILGRTASELSGLPVSAFAIAAYGLLTLAAVLLAICGFHIAKAAQMHLYRRPPYEVDTCIWAEKLREHHTKVGMSGTALEATVLHELKAHVLSEFAEAATQNRKINYQRAEGRGRGMRFFILSSAATFILSAVILIHNAVLPLLTALGEPLGPTAAASSAQSSGRALRRAPTSTTPLAKPETAKKADEPARLVPTYGPGRLGCESRVRGQATPTPAGTTPAAASPCAT